MQVHQLRAGAGKASRRQKTTRRPRGLAGARSGDAGSRGEQRRMEMRCFIPCSSHSWSCQLLKPLTRAPQPKPSPWATAAVPQAMPLNPAGSAWGTSVAAASRVSSAPGRCTVHRLLHGLACSGTRQPLAQPGPSTVPRATSASPTHTAQRPGEPVTGQPLPHLPKAPPAPQLHQSRALTAPTSAYCPPSRSPWTGLPPRTPAVWLCVSVFLPPPRLAPYIQEAALLPCPCP